MHTNRSVHEILDGALQGRAPSREDCVVLLSLPERSAETRHLMAVADEVTRRRFDNSAVLFGQIGVETAPCPGGCDFCTFSRKLNGVVEQKLPVETIVEKAKGFTSGGDLYALFLMTMHDWHVGTMEEALRAVRGVVPS